MACVSKQQFATTIHHYLTNSHINLAPGYEQMYAKDLDELSQNKDAAKAGIARKIKWSKDVYDELQVMASSSRPWTSLSLERCSFSFLGGRSAHVASSDYPELGLFCVVFALTFSRAACGRDAGVSHVSCLVCMNDA